mmetsp:Transcript_75602/g.104585  ORF Transcript_75602/g.104585 Transcript_75602/m.104585 type:complete len:108 (-) Transcript_75602:12-335(-)|eukprot:CAMPEP_0170462752 /NCGR_PEP_ID=MMETSP0123-20130129/8134_1 /TAXON_ID=182087 /ORGANISM="Favella ehrenbergii, Strain Fehren 1" /LENGTH=107 /DNA_ID=CAMNT_0010728039 /DNA_START=145 /DNA_END=468 /DNA_ORIENTATION=-
MSKVVSVAAILALGAQAAFRFSACPDVKPMETFDVDRYTGQWYEIVRDKWTPFELMAGCVNVVYTKRDEKSVVVDNAGYIPLYGWDNSIGAAVRAEGRDDAALIVNF